MKKPAEAGFIMIYNEVPTVTVLQQDKFQSFTTDNCLLRFG